MERSSLSRSNASRRPLFLITTSSRNSTGSKVVKRPPHSGQWRRRRMAELSSEGRESFTWLSSCPQNGQRIELFSYGTGLRIDGKAAAEIGDALLHAGLDLRIAFVMVAAGQAIDHFHDQLADFAEFGSAEAASGAGGRAQPDA